eukprot:205496-Hanusia_phi.AAC.1
MTRTVSATYSTLTQQMLIPVTVPCVRGPGPGPRAGTVTIGSDHSIPYPSIAAVRRSRGTHRRLPHYSIIPGPCTGGHSDESMCGLTQHIVAQLASHELITQVGAPGPARLTRRRGPPRTSTVRCHGATVSNRLDSAGEPVSLSEAQ